MVMETTKQFFYRVAGRGQKTGDERRLNLRSTIISFWQIF